MARQKRPNKYIYILSAIGAAAGLGNLRRFPMLAYEHGGGTFIFALLISNIVIVLPLIIMETIIGQKHQAGGPKVFAKIKKGSARIQRLPIIASIFILMYYAPIMARGEVFLVKIFSGAFLNNPTIYFGQEILSITTNINTSGTIQTPILIALVVAFISIALALSKGIKSVSNVLKYTVPIPFILLIVLGIHGLTLSGGAEGVGLLFKPERSQITNIKLRQAAIGQSFFSASLAFGYFIFAGSHKKTTDSTIKSSILILSGNFLASLLSGIAVFSTIGFMAKQQGQAFFEVMQGGAQLIFSALPTAISLMPFFKIGFAAFLFIVVITLAISSIIAFMEVITGAFSELKSKHKVKQNTYIKTILIVLGIVFAGTIPFTMGAGSYYIEITDHFVGGYIFILIGILETIVISRYFGKQRLCNLINKNEQKIICKKRYQRLLQVIPLVLTAVLISAIITEIKTGYQSYPNKYLRLFGILPLLLTIVIAVMLGKKQKK